MSTVLRSHAAAPSPGGSGESVERPGPSHRAVAVAAGLAALVAVLAAAAGIGVRSTHAAHVAVDEVQYALTALSLWEDRDLDISDELSERRWRDFADEPPPVQTQVLDGGRQVSPHDPVLALLLAAPMGVGGWVGAKLALATVAGAAAALTVWVAVRRFAVPVTLAGAGTALAFATPPLAVYGQQLYPELPAGLAVLGGLAALTASQPGLRHHAGVVVAVVALPWLGVKYAPVAAVLAGAALLRLLRGRRFAAALGVAGALAAAGGAYLLVHLAVWGGWTVYAAGDHFQDTGEFSVVGVDPDYAGRTVRLVGLLVDREFGLVAWQPAWLLVVPAAAALVRLRHWVPVALLAAGWATATWLALTMHGWWWPGRQVVVVLPVAVVAVLGWLAHVRRGLRPQVWRGAAALAAGLAGVGVITYVELLRAGWARALTWVVDFMTLPAPTYRSLRPLLPDYRAPDVLGAHLLWVGAVVALALIGWSTAARKHRHERESR